MRTLFPGLLPAAVLARTDKGDFTELGWGAHARAFIQAWDGTGVPDAVVDVKGLREEWSRPLPDARTALLLHAAWCGGSTPGGGE